MPLNVLAFATLPLDVRVVHLSALVSSPGDGRFCYPVGVVLRFGNATIFSGAPR